MSAHTQRKRDRDRHRRIHVTKQLKLQVAANKQKSRSTRRVAGRGRRNTQTTHGSKINLHINVASRQ